MVVRRERIEHRAEWAILLLIWLNVLALMLESVPGVRAAYGAELRAFEVFSIAVFTVEYVIRVVRGRARYAFSALGMVDLVAILPFYIPAVGIDLRMLRVARTVRVVRLLRLAKVGRYSLGLATLLRVFSEKRGELIAAFSVMVVALIVTSALMYFTEHAAQPHVFSSIPAAMWWAVTTLTTVGYGDVVPLTSLGRLLGGVVAVLGVGVFALPAGIIGAAFVEEFRRRREEATPAHCPHCGMLIGAEPRHAAPSPPPAAPRHAE